MAPSFSQPGTSIEGMTDTSVDSGFYQGYQPQYYQPMYITTTPMPQTPLAQMPPVFPAPAPVQPLVTQSVNVANQNQPLDRTVSAISDDHTGSNNSSSA